MKDKTNKEIGLRIQKLRKSNQMSLVQLAKLLEIPPSFLALIERGECNPPIKLLMGVCNIFDVSMDYITFEERE